MPITEGIIVPITADPAGLEAGMNAAKKSVDKFSSTGIQGVKAFELSIQDLNVRLSILKESLIKSTDPSVIKRLDTKIKETTLLIQQQKSAYNELGITSLQAGEHAKNAFVGLYGEVRRLAYILPGIGIGGIFALLFEGAQLAASAIFDVVVASKEADKALDAIKQTEDILEKSSQSFVDASNKVNVLKESFVLARQGVISKKDAIDEYNKSLGNALGKVNSLEEAESLLTQKGESYIRVTLLKAAANLALQEAAKKAFEAEQIRQKSADDFNTIKSRASVFSEGQSSAPGFVPGAFDINKSIKAQYDIANKVKSNLAKQADDAKNVLKNIAKKFQDDAAYISKEFGIRFFDDLIDPKDKKEKIKVDKKRPKFAEQLTVNEFPRIKAKVKEIDMLYENMGKTISHTDGLITKASMDAARATQIQLNKTLELKYALESLGSVVIPILDKAFDSFFSNLVENGKLSIGSLIGDIGKLISKLLSAALAAATLSALLSATGLGAVFGLGGTNGGFSNIFKSIFGSSTGIKLASGGITNGPTRALIGEGKEREVVTPLSQLKNIIGNSHGNQPVPVPQIFMKGNDFWIMYQKAQRLNQRNF